MDMLRRMNFPARWCRWIHGCVSSASANYLVNGSPSGDFALEKGLRQGDPLSPFLFLIAAEGISLLTKKAIQEGLLKAALIGRDKVELSHIQYADDTVFVVEGTKENATALKWILKCFELLSGLLVNFDKSKVFGVNIEREKLGDIANILGCTVGEGTVPYLGMKVG